MPKVSVVTLPSELLEAPRQTAAAVEPKLKRKPVAWGELLKPLAVLTRALVGISNLLPNILAFLLSRVAIMGEMSPFGIAFFAAIAGVSPRRALPAGLWAVGGVLSAGRYWEAGLYLAVIFLYYRFVDKLSRIEHKMLAEPLFMFGAVSLSGLALTVWQQATLYNILFVLFDGALCMVLTYIFAYGAPVILNPASRKEVSHETLLCAMAVLAVAVAGTGHISVWDYSLRNMLGSLLVMVLAVSGGAGFGSSAGVAVGLVIGLAEGNAVTTIAFYALAGAVAGVLRSFGKYAVILGFIFGSVVGVIYFDHALELLRVLAETAAAALVVAAVPARKLVFWEDQIARESGAAAAEQVVAPALDKLNQLAGMFNDLADTIGHISVGAKEKIREDETNYLLSTVGKQVCGECQRRSECWEKDFYKTYQAMLDTFAMAEAGSLTLRTMTKPLKDNCHKKAELIETINLVAERNRVNHYWQKRLSETRQMVTEQMRATGLILTNLGQEMRKDPRSDKETEKKLEDKCAVVGCGLKSVQISGDESTKTVDIRKSPCNGTRECVNTVLPIAASLVREKMTLDARCGNAVRNKSCHLSLQVAKRYTVETGIAYIAKEQGVCGDTCSVAPLNRGKVSLMLSDGMGSGKQAANESAMAVRFLERLLAAGFDVDVAVKTVNSMLMLRTPDESFATVDMCIIDTYSGETEFLKIGSAPTFIKRVREVTTVTSASLPIGILHQIEIEPIRVSLVGGDIIVMVSDGIADVLPRGVEKENWVANVLRRTAAVNPQDIADLILAQAKELAGVNVRDDMTVLAARLVEKSGIV